MPLFYTPFISFPVGNERKSGFLFPTIGSSSRSGYSLSVPWYWDVAPNYDATFTPTYFTRRGAKLGSIPGVTVRDLTWFGVAQADVRAMRTRAAARVRSGGWTTSWRRCPFPARSRCTPSTSPD